MDMVLSAQRRHGAGQPKCDALPAAGSAAMAAETATAGIQEIVGTLCIFAGCTAVAFLLKLLMKVNPQVGEVRSWRCSSIPSDDIRKLSTTYRPAAFDVPVANEALCRCRWRSGSLLARWTLAWQTS